MRIGPIPAHEFVQAAELGDTLGAGSQHQMIGVAEDDIGAGIAHLLRVKRFYRAHGADRHERRRTNDAARRRDFPAPRRSVRGENAKAELRIVPNTLRRNVLHNGSFIPALPG